MESACMNLQQIWGSSSSPLSLNSSHDTGASPQRPIRTADLICQRNGGSTSTSTSTRAFRRRCSRMGGKVGGRVRVGIKISASHGDAVLFSGALFGGKIPVVGKGLEKKRFAVPRDFDLEEEGEQVDSDLAGVVSRADSEVGSSEVATIETSTSGGLFANFPKRYKLIVATSLAFVICNMDKVNMSVAIIPMSHQLGWSASTAGIVQSSFFWGYAVSQLPGGFLAGRFTGKKVLQVGVFAWSAATALVPICAPFLPGLLFCRILVGLGEGVSPSAATDLIARTMPVYERSRAVSFVFGGLNVGSVLGLLLAPVIIRHFGWEVVFYIFGVIGVAWCVGFNTATHETDEKQPSSSVKSTSGENGTARLSGGSKESSDPHAASFDLSDKGIPWKAFFKDPAVWAMMYAHFCGNWGHFNLLSWMPTYFSDELNLNLTNSALVSILPPLGSVAVSAAASTLADHLIANGTDSTFVRKLCQSIAFISPATCMSVVALFPDLSPVMTAGILTVGSSLSTFSLAGLYCTHQDISPKYASVLLGLTNTVGAVPGILGVALTGYILEHTKSWNLALLAPSIFFYVTGAIVWNIFASSEPKDFASTKYD